MKGRKGSGLHSRRNWRRLPEQGTVLLLHPREIGSASIVSSSVFSTFQLPLNTVKYGVQPKSATERVMRTPSLDKLLPNFAILLLYLCWTSETYG